jgi:hypothetical protein
MRPKSYKQEVSDLKSKINDVLTILNGQLDVRVANKIHLYIGDDGGIINKTLHTFVKELIDILIGDDTNDDGCD